MAELDRVARALSHDPSTASQGGGLALAFAGQGMRIEVQNVLDHANTMDRWIRTVNGQGRPARSRRSAKAVQILYDTGDHLRHNGQAMLDCADRVRRSPDDG